MLLRSITKHVKDQNWFAVFLDFFIVVAGMVIAFQITNWSEARKINGEANEFTNQLKADLAEEAWVYEFVIEYYGDVRDNAARVVDALEGKSELSDQTLIIAAYRATQYAPILRRRETFDELTATGRINLIGHLAISEQRLSLTNHGMVRYQLKTPYRDGTTHVSFCLLYTSPSPRDLSTSRMPSSA